MLAFAVIADKSYLPKVKVLFDSIKIFHPESPILLYSWDIPDAITLPNYPKAYAKERANVIKSALDQYDKVVFLGADMELFARMDEAEEKLNTYDFVTVPHIVKPLPNDDLTPNEHRIFCGGLCNADFQLWRRSPNTDIIINWYQERLLIHGDKLDIAQGFVHEQSWINMIPFEFDNCHIWRTMCYNVSYWNVCLYNMRLEKNWITDGGPLVLYHYSGFDPENISVYQNRWKPMGNLKLFYENYANRLNRFYRSTPPPSPL